MASTSGRLQKIYIPAKDAVVEKKVQDTATTARGIELPPWKAFEATIATQGLFNTCHVQEKTQSGSSLRFLDDGFPYDIRNPAILVLKETKRLYPNAKIATFLSVGTGIPAVDDIQNFMSRRSTMGKRLHITWPLKVWAPLAQSLLKSRDHQIDQKLRAGLGDEVYWRTNLDSEKLYVSGIEPTDYYKVTEIAQSMKESFEPLWRVRFARLAEQLSHLSSVPSGSVGMSLITANTVTDEVGNSVEET
jgi:hypothetical protein